MKKLLFDSTVNGRICPDIDLHIYMAYLSFANITLQYLRHNWAVPQHSHFVLKSIYDALQKNVSSYKLLAADGLKYLIVAL
jgi:hypothetical protein